jgi:XTP/dITP diphosphohydrolase
VKKILIASTNSAKIAELKIGLQELQKEGIQILTLNDVIVGDKEPIESGATFQENSLIKAKFYATLTNLPCLSDDGGLLIPYLNNEPGVRSKRWLGYDATDEELIKYTLTRLSGCTDKKRTAYLETYLCFFDPQTKKIIYETEKIKGYIANRSSGRPTYGYPYRALFMVEKYNKYYDELTIKEHREVNHRLIALKRLTKKIGDLLL